MPRKKKIVITPADLPPLPPGEVYPTSLNSETHLFYPFEGETEDLIIADLVSFARRCFERELVPVFVFENYRKNPEQNIFSNKMDHRSIVGPHRHDYYEINFSLQGKCYQYINDEAIVMEEGDMLLMHPDIIHANYPPRSGFSVNILIDERFMHALAAELSAVDPQNPVSTLISKKAYMIFDTHLSPTIKAAAQMIYDRFSYRVLPNHSFAELLVETKARELFLQLILGLESGTVTCRNRGLSSYEDKVERILAYIRSNYESVTLSAVCQKFGYSERQLHRIIAKYAGTSFSAFVGKLKFNRAAYLLMRTDQTVDEISHSVGMEKTAFFRFFKKYSTMSPIKYRKRFSDQNKRVFN